MPQSTNQKAIRELLKQLQRIRFRDPAGIFGITPRETAMQDLRRAAALLGRAGNGQIHDLAAQTAQALDAALVLGAISETEHAELAKLLKSIG